MQITLTTASPTSTAIKVKSGLTGIYAAGTWGSGTITVSYSPTSSGTFVAIGSGFSMTADKIDLVRLTAGWIKLTLAGSTGANLAVNVDTAEGTPLISLAREGIPA